MEPCEKESHGSGNPVGLFLMPFQIIPNFSA